MQNTFNCAIPIFWSIIKNLWIFPNFQVFFKFILGAVSCGAQDRISPWAPQLTAPKKNPTLGAATYGAQEEFHLGRRNLRRPRRILPWAPQLTASKTNLENNLKMGKIQSFFMMLQKIGIAQLNVFCTALGLWFRAKAVQIIFFCAFSFFLRKLKNEGIFHPRRWIQPNIKEVGARGSGSHPSIWA